MSTKKLKGTERFLNFYNNQEFGGKIIVTPRIERQLGMSRSYITKLLKRLVEIGKASKEVQGKVIIYRPLVAATLDDVKKKGKPVSSGDNKPAIPKPAPITVEQIQNIVENEIINAFRYQEEIIKTMFGKLKEIAEAVHAVKVIGVEHNVEFERFTDTYKASKRSFFRRAWDALTIKRSIWKFRRDWRKLHKQGGVQS